MQEKPSREHVDSITLKLGMSVSLLSVVSLAFYAGVMNNRVDSLEETMKLLASNQQTLTIISTDINYFKRDLAILERDLKEVQRKLKLH